MFTTGSYAVIDMKSEPLTKCMKISQSVHNALQLQGRKGETFDSIIRRIIGLDKQES
jgi:hypothetical protein